MLFYCDNTSRFEPQLMNLSVWRVCHTDNPKFAFLSLCLANCVSTEDLLSYSFRGVFQQFPSPLRADSRFYSRCSLSCCCLSSVLPQYSRTQQGPSRRKIPVRHYRARVVSSGFIAPLGKEDKTLNSTSNGKLSGYRLFSAVTA
jgi:hypothetical protein